jgi:hypothetical protein
MIYLPEELELLLKTTMKVIGFKRNSGNLEINEYEVTSNKSDYFCGGLIFNFDVSMIFEEKNKNFYNKEFQDTLNQNFGVSNVSINNIENNRVQVSMSLTQAIAK